MKANVAVYTFAICVFVAFLLWSAKNLGIIGLLGAFSVGLISYSMDSSIETAVASVVIAGVIIKFILPSIQAKWIEKYANYDAPVIEQPIHSAERTRERIEAMQKGEKSIEGFRGLAPQLLEGFAGEMTDNLAATIPSNRMPPVGGTPGTNQTKLSPTVGTSVPGQGVLQTSGGTSTQQVGQTGQTAPISGVSFKADQGSVAQQVLGTAVQQPVPTKPPSIAYGAAQQAQQQAQPPSMAYGAAQQAQQQFQPPSIAYGAAQPQVQPQAQQQMNTTFNMSPPPPSAPVQPGGTTNLAALNSQSTPDLSSQTSGQISTQVPSSTNTIAAPVKETFEEQPQAVPGMFKLGELPSEGKGGPHIDAGTTIMRALGALNPDQISSLTEDTRKLLDTQKSLMGMLSTMKPMLSDGQNLLASFTNMFGKTN